MASEDAHLGIHLSSSIHTPFVCFNIDLFLYLIEVPTNGTYNCQDGKGTTIQKNQVCDFKNDCPNAMDESNCG